jgi:hypothetical protein
MDFLEAGIPCFLFLTTKVADEFYAVAETDQSGYNG